MDKPEKNELLLNMIQLPEEEKNNVMKDAFDLFDQLSVQGVKGEIYSDIFFDSIQKAVLRSDRLSDEI